MIGICNAGDTGMLFQDPRIAESVLKVQLEVADQKNQERWNAVAEASLVVGHEE